MSATRPAPLVLVVDDNVDATESLALILELEGYRVACATDGRGALAAVQREAPAAVLLDLSLPDIDGFEVARRLRAHPSSARILVAAISGHGSQSTRDAAQQAGFDAHYTKPVEPDSILAFLRTGLAAAMRRGQS